MKRHKALRPWRLGGLTREKQRRHDHPRSKSRSPTHPNRSRKAAKPQRARLSPPRRGHPDRRHRSGTPSPAPRHGERRRHPRPLCGSAPLREKTTPPRPPPARRADRHTRTGRAEPQSRRALTSSAIVGNIHTVGAGRPPPRHGDRRRYSKLLAAWRLGARKTTPPRPPPLEEPIADTPEQVAQSRKAAKSSAQPSTSRTSRPSAPERDAQPSSASRRSSATPQTSLRLCASARDERRRHDHRPLEEPIDTPEQVAQSRRAAERSPQARSSGTSRPSERDAQLRVTAIVGDTPTSSAWRALHRAAPCRGGPEQDPPPRLGHPAAHNIARRCRLSALLHGLRRAQVVGHSTRWLGVYPSFSLARPPSSTAP
jgi:hypothetical protein